MIGDADLSGYLSANIFHQIGSRLRLKFQAQVTNTFLNYQHYLMKIGIDSIMLSSGFEP